MAGEGRPEVGVGASLGGRRRPRKRSAATARLEARADFESRSRRLAGGGENGEAAPLTATDLLATIAPVLHAADEANSSRGRDRGGRGGHSRKPRPGEALRSQEDPSGPSWDGRARRFSTFEAAPPGGVAGSEPVVSLVRTREVRATDYAQTRRMEQEPLGHFYASGESALEDWAKEEEGGVPHLRERASGRPTPPRYWDISFPSDVLKG
ncbi:unnamed protein product [Phytomonas sp. Hart1]|nr:unnamed protein product [Phytomonas sp. Hart1]|eukprot:CCW70741.1 unnamed protein product [Phytomonas sp. isolate Hart1]